MTLLTNDEKELHGKFFIKLKTYSAKGLLKHEVADEKWVSQFMRWRRNASFDIIL